MKHQERLNMLRNMEESLPNQMQEIEEQLKVIMEIEQADEIQLVLKIF
jgi:hypothetical protein